VIERDPARKGDPRDELLTCPVCGWAVTWGEYHLSFKRKQVNSGGATTAFETFARRYPSARTPQEKMLAIDRLIHEFHYSYRDRPDLPTRPVGVNLIEGRVPDVVRFLDELTYGEGAPREAVENKDAWREKLAEIPWIDFSPAGGAGDDVRPASSHGPDCEGGG
jgi:hypothetical protein